MSMKHPFCMRFSSTFQNLTPNIMYFMDQTFKLANPLVDDHDLRHQQQRQMSRKPDFGHDVFCALCSLPVRLRI